MSRARCSRSSSTRSARTVGAYQNEAFETVDYVLGVRKERTANISMATDNGANYFNILAPGENEVALFDGSR